jgi:outer membrane murein-binding lipoprotein Lpp
MNKFLDAEVPPATIMCDMTTRSKLLLAAAVAALAVAGCATSNQGTDTPASTVQGSSTAVSSEGKQQQAQQLAEDAQKVMLDPALPPTEKYPKALEMFRNALKIDPDNALAKDGVNLIEDVYRSMGRPVPQTT